MTDTSGTPPDKGQRKATDIDRKIARVLRARRLQIRMGQERLANILGITFQQIQKYESGVNRIAASRLFEMLSALQLTFGEFAASIELVDAGGSEMSPAPENELETRLLGLFRRATPAVQAKLVEFVETMVADHE